MKTIILNNQKVLRVFKGKPEQGIACYALPKKRVTVGVRWSLPHKDYIPDDDVHVTPHVALHLIKRHKEMSEWKVIVEPQYHKKTTEWLLTMCR